MATERANPESTSLTDRFMRTDSFNELYQHAIRYATIPMNPNQSKKVQQYFAGALFEELAFDYFHNQLDIQQLVSPDETFVQCLLSAWKRNSLHKQVRTIDRKFGRKHLYKINTPDGLFRDESGLYAVEYSLVQNEAYFRMKANNFHYFQRDFDSNAKLLFVTPESTTIPNDVLEREYVTTPATVPIGGNKVRAFVDWIYTTYRPSEDSATLAEIQNETAYQYAWHMQQIGTPHTIDQPYMLDPEDFLARRNTTMEAVNYCMQVNKTFQEYE